MATWTAVQVFGDANAHHGRCCQCCNGYCPESDSPQTPTPPNLYRLGPYLSDNYVAILADLIDPEPREGQARVIHLPEPRTT